MEVLTSVSAYEGRPIVATVPWCVRVPNTPTQPLPITGWLQRRFAPRSLFVTAAAAIVAGATVAALAPTYPVLLAGRLVRGVGTGIVTPVMFTIILTRSPRSSLGSLTHSASLVMGPHAQDADSAFLFEDLDNALDDVEW